MKLRLVLSALACLCCVTVSVAATDKKDRSFAEKNYAAGAALCAGAKVYFACQTDFHLLALCSDIDGDGVTLRFGDGGQTSLSLPRNPDDKISVTAGNLTYAGHGGAYMRFKDGKAEYLLYSAMGDTWKQAGLSKIVGGRTVEENICPAGTAPMRTFFPDLARQSGYVEEPGRNFESEMHINWRPVERKK